MFTIHEDVPTKGARCLEVRLSRQSGLVTCLQVVKSVDGGEDTAGLSANPVRIGICILRL